MPISNHEFAIEEKRLADTLSVIRKKISTLGVELFDQKERGLEFKKFLWDAHAEMDPAEMKVMMSNNDVDISIMKKRGDYLQKLFRIQNKPYFGSIVFREDGALKKDTIYIGITHVEENLDYYVHDWRSPICSMFYDYEIGEATYEAPIGRVHGVIERKRQYTIENAKLIHIFDNELNIDDELLQEVLATESSDQMKNIVNTIQKEQNQVIRNVRDKNLIVQGIAGSGKTSVALHRIAFLLYKISDLSTDDILIFSPNQVFSEYIANVLPELGEDNTLQTTYHSFMNHYLKEFKQVESFTSFIERYYQEQVVHYDLIRYKQSDRIVQDLECYIENLVKNSRFDNDIFTKDITILRDELNRLFHIRYQHFPAFKRIEVIAEKLCDRFYDGKYSKKRSVVKILLDHFTLKRDYLQIYNQFFQSHFAKIRIENQTISNKKLISYEDATIFIYMKGLLEGIDYNTSIKQIVIDEAQDYTRTQYLILTKIFKNANYTILGDVNQTINPYYKYDSLNVITEMISSSRYLELQKTYRSSEEIIRYTNQILGLKHVSAIRRSNQRKVIQRNDFTNLKEIIFQDIRNLQKDYKSIAIITKTDEEAERLHQLLYKQFPIILIRPELERYCRSLVVLPSYVAKGLEFDAVIVYTDKENPFLWEERYLFYVACTRAQHQLLVYNQNIMR